MIHPLFVRLILASFLVLETTPLGALVPDFNASQLDVSRQDLRPMGRVTETERMALGEFLAGFARRSERDDFTAAEEFLGRFPHGAWAPALRLRLAEEYYVTGWYSKALAALETLWAERGSHSVPEAAVLTTHVGVQLAELYARLGRREEVEWLLAELSELSIAPDDLETLRGVQQGLATMQSRPETAFRCGALALERIRVFQNTANAGHAALLDSKSSSSGMSLAEIADLSATVGMNYQMAFRSAGAPHLTPAIMHLGIGHFVAVVRERDHQLQIEDPTGWQTTFASRAAVETEASGYFLVLPGALPAGWRPVDAGEGSTVYGRNGVLDSDPDSTGRRDRKARCGGGGSYGMATWDVHLALVSQQIIDTPLRYEPPFGPPIEVTWRHTQRANRRFGYKPKWTHNWTGQIYEDPRTPLGDLWLQEEGGWERFSPLDDEGRSYQGRNFNTGRLARPDAATIVWQLPDGTERTYTTFTGTQAAWGRVFYLSAISDNAGNRVTIQLLPGGRVESLTDPLGRVTRFYYELANPGTPPPGDPDSGVIANWDYTNQVTRMVDPFGRSALLQYAKVERSITGFCGSPGGGDLCPIYYYNYDLTNITDVAGMSSQFAYDASGTWVTELTTPYGTTRFHWVGFVPGEYAIDITDPAGDTERIVFNPPGSDGLDGALWKRPQGMRTDGGGFVVAHWGKQAYAESLRGGSLAGATLQVFQRSETFASVGRGLLAFKPPLESAIWLNYPGQGAATLPGIGDQPTRVGRVLDDGSTQLWQTDRDAWGNVLRRVDPLGRTTRYLYAANFIDLLEVRQVIGSREELLLRLTWNDRHQPLSVTDAAGQTTRYAYNARGQLTSTTNAANETTAFEYDASGFLTAVDGPLPGTQDRNTFTYDSIGRVRTATDPDGYQVAFDYDSLDRITRLTFPDSTFESMVYDRMELGVLRDRLGQETRFTHDGLRRIVAVQDALGRITQLQWCGCGDLSALVDPLGRMTQWHRDLQGRLVAKEYADGSQVSYEYESSTSRLRQRRDERNQLTEFTYNAADEVLARRYLNSEHPTPDVLFTFDPHYRRVSTMTDGNGTTSFHYHPVNGQPGAGQLATLDGPWPNDEVSYTYDALGRTLERAIVGVAVRWTHDPAGRLKRMTNALGAFDYDWVGASDRLASVLYPNGQRTEYAYHPNTREALLQRLTHLRPGGSKLSEFTYAYDALSRITNWTQLQSGRTKTWHPTYDAVGRLTNLLETVQTPATTAWAFDAADNRTWEQVAGNRVESGYNALNQLTEVELDTSIAPASYAWDAENRLVTISNTTRRIEISYDGLDRRTRMITREADNVVRDRRYLWSGMQLCEERDASGAVVLKRYSSHGIQSYGTSELPAGNYFFTRDHLGSVREMTSAAGVTSVYDYTAFGEQLRLGNGLDPDFGFTGHFQAREVDLLLAPYRAYSPSLARWLSRDPSGESGGLNLYAYAAADPINRFDPDGYQSRSAVLVDQTQGYKDAAQGTKAYDQAKEVAQLTDKMLDKGIKEGLKNQLDDAAKKAMPEGAEAEYEKLMEEARKNKESVNPFLQAIKDLWNGSSDQLAGECQKPKPKAREPKPKPAVPEKGVLDSISDFLFGPSEKANPAQLDGPIQIKPTPMSQFNAQAAQSY